MRVEQIGYGAGTRNSQGFPNVLRLSIGESTEMAIPELLSIDLHQHANNDHDNSQSVTVIETALDDLSPQILAYVAETAFAKGALDVMLTPVIMKKGRPGTLLTVLCNDSKPARWSTSSSRRPAHSVFASGRSGAPALTDAT